MKCNRLFGYFFLFLCLLLVRQDSYAQWPELGSFFTTDTASINAKGRLAERIKADYPDSAKAIYKTIWQQSLNAGYSRGARKALFALGVLAIQNSEYEMSNAYFKQSVPYYDTQKDKETLTLIYNKIGNNFSKRLKLPEAMDAYTIALRYALPSSLGLASTYTNMGDVLQGLDQNDKAQAYFDKALPIFLQENDTLDWCGVLINKGMCYNSEKQYSLGTLFLDSAMHIARKHRLYRVEVTAAINLMLLYEKTGQKYKALSVLEQTLPLTGQPVLQSRERNFLLIQAGSIYIAIKQYETAKRYLHTALASIKGDTYNYLNIVYLLSQLYAEEGHYEKAYNFRIRYDSLQDSLGNNKVAMDINELETKYRTAQKDKVITESKLRISEQDKRLANKTNWILGIVAGSLLVIMLLSWRYLYLRQKNKRLQSQQAIEHLKAEMEGEQKERSRIATELHDGIVSELTAIKMNLDAATQSEASAQEYQRQLNELGNVINDVRNTAHNLMPEILLRHGLAESVGLLCETLQKTGRLDVEYQQYGDFSQLDMAFRKTVYHIIQELLHNIIKHARATHALVQLSSYNGLFTANIEDNGIGMDRQRKNQDSMGLMSIERRVKQLNGKVEWTHAASGKGTNVYLEFEV